MILGGTINSYMAYFPNCVLAWMSYYFLFISFSLSSSAQVDIFRWLCMYPLYGTLVLKS